MSACYQLFELLHTPVYVDRNVRIYVVIVLDGIRRAGMSFYDVRVVAAYTVAGIVGVMGVFDDSGVPYVRNA